MAKKKIVAAAKAALAEKKAEREKEDNVAKHLSDGEVAFAVKDICSAITDIRSRIDRIVEAHEKCKSLKDL